MTEPNLDNVPPFTKDLLVLIANYRERGYSLRSIMLQMTKLALTITDYAEQVRDKTNLTMGELDASKSK